MKTKVNVSAENSFNIMSDFPEFVDGPRYMELYNEADLSRNPNKSKDQLLYSDRRIQLTRDGVNPYVYPNVDWQDVIFKKMTMTQRANINVSGGGTKVKYYMSLNVSHDSGLLNTEKAYSWNNNINIMNYTFQNNISCCFHSQDIYCYFRAGIFFTVFLLYVTFYHLTLENCQLTLSASNDHLSHHSPPHYHLPAQPSPGHSGSLLLSCALFYGPDHWL